MKLVSLSLLIAVVACGSSAEEPAVVYVDEFESSIEIGVHMQGETAQRIRASSFVTGQPSQVDKELILDWIGGDGDPEVRTLAEGFTFDVSEDGELLELRLESENEPFPDGWIVTFNLTNAFLLTECKNCPPPENE